MSLDNTLNERGARYGDFTDHARICQTLKRTMMNQVGWGRLEDVHKQALDVIADKIARILSGDPNYADNWHDIQGYAKLVEDRLDLFTNMDKQPQKTPAEIERVERKIAESDAAIQKELQAGYKRVLFDMNAALAQKSTPRENADTCNCPACTLRRAIEAQLGGGVEVRMSRIDPDEDEGPEQAPAPTGPLKH